METGLRRAREEGISVVLLKAGPGSSQGSGIRDAEEGASLRKDRPDRFEGLEDQKAFWLGASALDTALSFQHHWALSLDVAGLVWT